MGKLKIHKRNLTGMADVVEEYETFFTRYGELIQWDTRDYFLLDCKILPDEITTIMITDPEQVMFNMNEALKNCQPPDAEGIMRVCPINIPNRKGLKDICGSDIEQLVAVDVIIRKVKQKQPRLLNASFTCQKCMSEIVIPQDMEQLEEPLSCSNGNCNRDSRATVFTFNPDKSEFIDVEVIYAEEPRDNLKNPEPYKLIALMKDDLCQELSPGQRVIINGVIKPKHKKDNKFDTYLDVVSFENVDENFTEMDISPEDVEEIQELAAHPLITERLIRMISPQTIGLDMIKEALLLQLFGGVEKDFNDRRIRGDMNILLIGDPGTSKSVILRHLSKIAPRAVFGSGKGSSAAGLTAIATHDEEDGEWTIEAGLLPLADRGLAIIDEFDKMSDSDRKSIHEPMEQQQVSYAKAGLVGTLQARTSILAAANPKKGRFNTSLIISEQIDLDPATISRFDVMFVIMDYADKKRDAEVSGRILENSKLLTKAMLGDADARAELDYPIPKDLFRKYIAYAKQNIKPIMTDSASKVIQEHYLVTREASKKRELEDGISRVAITPRQLEALIRLTEASAKSRLSSEADDLDANRAIKIFQFSMDAVCRDSSGNYDIDILESGISRERESKIDKILRTIRDLEKNNDDNIAYAADIIQRSGLDDAECTKMLEKLNLEGVIISPGTGVYKIT